ncbi:hypothetical protein MRB53_038005 [Persea americana]|nr:hypothetical protein MRB53_038005 [Persea americana]
MWGGSHTQRRRTSQDRSRWPMHSVQEYAHDPKLRQNSSSDGATSYSAEREPYDDNAWGETHDHPAPDPDLAREDYERLRHELTVLSQTKSRESRRSASRVRTQGSRRSDAFSRRSEGGETSVADEENGNGLDEEDFQLDEFMREGHFEKRRDNRAAKKVGVVYKDLTVLGSGSTATFVKTLPDAVIGTFGPDLYRILCRFMPFLRFGRQGATRTLINKFTGLVRDGEMMLVLGRPGSGCTTFLKAIANDRAAYAGVTGEVSYGGIDAAKQKKLYRGEVNYNPEDDVHFPELNVVQTFVFALLNKTKKRDKHEIPVIVDALLRMFGISHTRYTLVGNEYVRGVSGGERKRVSIAETLATKSTVVCWDNSTRGLDASTALDYARSLRTMTDISNKTTLVTLYQAGQGIYELMDKVLVIYEGRCVYQGPAKDARQYFIDLGFHCPDRQTTADFLTACTDPHERRFREGCESSTPKTAEEMEAAFWRSRDYQRVIDDVAHYEKELRESDLADAKEFEETVQEGKSHKTVSKKSPYTVSFFRQVLACSKRELWLLWGDKATLWTKAFIIVAKQLDHRLSELIKAVTGRAVVARQKEYAFYRPSAVTIARVLVDFPVLLPQVIVFSIVAYFVTELAVDVSKFFIYMLFVYTTTFCITSLYRMFASLSPSIDDAVRFSGTALVILIIFTGYVIPKPQLLSEYIWFGWLYYINPMAYAFEGVLTNEFTGRTMQCTGDYLVPRGQGIDPANQGCAFVGAAVNGKSVDGATYLREQYSYTRSHLWRNWAVIIAFTVLYIIITAIATELFDFSNSGGGAMVFKKSHRSKKAVAAAPQATDEEKGSKLEDSSVSSRERSGSEEDAMQAISSSQSVFTWENVNYSVPYQGGTRQLLTNVNGYAKPGVMVALMGASGAGKTTLLNTLAQRQRVGVVQGDMLVDGHPLESTFQRATGFCEQMDLHDGTATVREALEFSAVLRQDRDTPRAEKIEYVDKIIDLLELGEIQDAIGVELAAKPSLLLFLDEPTSGLDSQSAYSIVRFLRKLATAGQAIVCTSMSSQ